MAYEKFFFILAFRIYFSILLLYMYASVWVYATWRQLPGKTKEGTGSRGAELQAVLSCLTWILRTELWFSARTANTFNCSTVSLDDVQDVPKWELCQWSWHSKMRTDGPLNTDTQKCHSVTYVQAVVYLLPSMMQKNKQNKNKPWDICWEKLQCTKTLRLLPLLD